MSQQILAALEAKGLPVTWDYPGLARIQVSPTMVVSTGLNGWEYGTVDTLSADGTWEPSSEVAEPDLDETVTDPEVIAQAWATWLAEVTR